MSNTSLTAHCIVKNEEHFIRYAIESVIEHVDQVFVFDTGSTDATISILKELAVKYPKKITFEEKGLCTKEEHTYLRQEMLDRTKTAWFMVLDGDEIWTKRGMEEMLYIICTEDSAQCILAPYYLCVGDIFHHSVRGKYVYGDMKIHALPRVFKITTGVAWNLGPYGNGDYVKDAEGDLMRIGNYVILRNKYWHASALERSSKDNEVYLGRHKQVMTYSLKIMGEGFSIRESVPEAFGNATHMRLPMYKSWINALLLVVYGLKIVKRRLWI